MEDEAEKTKASAPLDLDWDTLLPSQDTDEPPPVLVVTEQQQQRRQHRQKKASAVAAESQREDLERMTDKEIEESKQRQKKLFDMSLKLPDKGERIRATIKRLEEEQERRKLRAEKEADAREKHTQSNSFDFSGSSAGVKQETPSSETHTQSLFASHFSKRMEENQTDCKPNNAFDKEVSLLGRCDRRKMNVNGQSSLKGGHKSKQSPFQFPSSLSLDKDQLILSNGDGGTRASSTCSPRQFGENMSSCFAKKRNASQVLCPKGVRPKKEHTVVLVDEEEPQQVEKTYQTDTLAECLKETKIYYPSRDDLESIEICYSDIKCLAPEAFLTSTIMNFYIRYLQQPASTTDGARCDYHFFNTYFYKKLKEAVSYKGSDKDTFFMKFRRWWKGVNIFQKPYVFIPIHETLHWSLVIICIPDEEDEAGPIILHLDSLGLHNSRIIFGNIKSYIKEEWNYMNQEIAPPDVLISERIWNNLPRRIEEKSIAAHIWISSIYTSKPSSDFLLPYLLLVPQQRNDYDCGLFVLYFMERFIEVAPERLKKKDLAMFGKQWFKPQDASNLRGKIKNLLMKEFTNAK